MAAGSAPPPPPEPEVVARHRHVVVAGHTGDVSIVAAHRDDPAPMVRAAALSAWARLGRCTARDIDRAFADESDQVRAEMAEHEA